MGRRENRRGLNVGALLALGAAVVTLVRRLTKKKAPESKPAPTLTPEEAPRPEGENTASDSEAAATQDESTERPAPATEDVEASGRAGPGDRRKAPGPEPDRVDEAEYESFPASDPPSWTR